VPKNVWRSERVQSLYSRADLLKKPGFCGDELETDVTFTTTEDVIDLQICEKPGFWTEWRDCTLLARLIASFP